ncbi:MAG: AAA family ATPase [Xylophilus ampelinus]
MDSKEPKDDGLDGGSGNESRLGRNGAIRRRGSYADQREVARCIQDLVQLAHRVRLAEQAAIEAEARQQDHFVDSLMEQGLDLSSAIQVAEQIHASELADLVEHEVGGGPGITSDDSDEDMYAEAEAEEAEVAFMGPDPFALRLYAPEELDAALRQIPKDRSRHVVRSFLSELGERGPDRQLSFAPRPSALTTLAERFPNFAEVTDYLAGRAALANLTPSSPLQFPPLLLEGEPGIGKTAFATALAEVMAMPLLALPMAHSNGPFMLGGLDVSFEGGGPGLLARSVALGRAVDPLVLLDEIDKVSLRPNHDPLGPLYALWERHTAEYFRDEGLPLTLNLSAVRWIATANGSEGLHPALRSRCQVFRIPAPTPDQTRGIAQRVYADLVARQPWGRHFDAALPDSVAELLSQSYPRELTRRLTDAFANAALAGRLSLQVTDVPQVASVTRPPGFF